MSSTCRVPQLRFGEFSGEWKRKKLGSIATFTSSKRVYLSDYIDNGIPFYRGKEISELKRGITPKDILYISQESYDKYKYNFGVPQINDLLITAVGTLGNILRIKDNSPFYFKDGNLIWVKNITEIASLLEILLEVKNHDIQRTSIGSTQRALTMVELRKLSFLFPQKQEQKKIASFLSSVDTKIEQLTSKTKLLQEYKKGVMQKIFSQEIRFRDDDGSGYSEWVERKYGEIYSFYTTNSFSRDNLNYESGKVKNIHYGDIHTKFSVMFDINKEELPFINDDINLSKIKEESYCQDGDLIIADASEDYADIGKTIEIVNLNNEKVVAGLHTFLARPNKYDMAIGYTGYLLQSWQVRWQVMRIAQGSKVLSLSTKRLSEVILNIPSKLEQTKIASFLSSIDSKIEQSQKQLDSTKEFKKALLQQMFV